MRVLILSLAACMLAGQTQIDLKSQARRVGFSQADSTKPFKTGTQLPAQCSVGEAFLLLSAPTSRNLYICVVTNVWTQSSGQLPPGTTNGEVITWDAANEEWAPGPSSQMAVQIDGATQGARGVLNFTGGNGMLVTATSGSTAVRIGQTIDTAVIQTRTRAQSGQDVLAIGTSTNGTEFTAAMQPAVLAYVNGMVIQFRPERACSGSTTLNIDRLGAKSLRESDGITPLTCSAGVQIPLWFDATGNVWRRQETPVPSMNIFTTLWPVTPTNPATITGAGQINGQRIFLPATLKLNSADLLLHVAGTAGCRTGIAVCRLNDSLNGSLVASGASQDACDGVTGRKTVVMDGAVLSAGEYYVAVASTSITAQYAAAMANDVALSFHSASATAPLTIRSLAGAFTTGGWPATVSFTAPAVATPLYAIGLRK